jgi:hypothetical protein
MCIYIKNGKREKRKKKKEFLVKRAGGISAQPSARAAALAAGPARPANGARRGDSAVGAGPHASEGEGDDVRGNDGSPVVEEEPVAAGLTVVLRR